MEIHVRTVLPEQLTLGTESEHDSDESFVAALSFDAGDGTPIHVSDTGEILGGASVDGDIAVRA